MSDPRPTMGFHVERELAILVHGERPPTQDEWAQYIRALEEARPRRLLVVSQGGGPNAAQRAEVVRVLKAMCKEDGIEFATAVLSSSALARGITTAIRWLSGAELKSFHYHDIKGAMSYLGLPSTRLADVTGHVRTLQELVQSEPLRIPA